MAGPSIDLRPILTADQRERLAAGLLSRQERTGGRNSSSRARNQAANPFGQRLVTVQAVATQQAQPVFTAGAAGAAGAAGHSGGAAGAAECSTGAGGFTVAFHR